MPWRYGRGRKRTLGRKAREWREMTRANRSARLLGVLSRAARIVRRRLRGDRIVDFATWGQPAFAGPTCAESGSGCDAEQFCLDPEARRHQWR